MVCNGVAEVTPWRIREMRRKNAIWRDKQQIMGLQRDIQTMQDQLSAWERWYFTVCWRWIQTDSTPKKEEEEDDDAHMPQLRKQQQQQLQQQHPVDLSQRPVSVIDYSRWEHLSCYSEEPDVAEVEKDEYLDEGYLEQPRRTAGEWYKQDEGLDEFMDDEDEISEPVQEEEEEEDEDKYGEPEQAEKDEERQSSAVEVREVAEEPQPDDDEEYTLSTDCTNNKDVILRRMEDAQRKVRRAQERLDVERASRFHGQLQHQQQQIETYLGMTAQLDVQEFKEGGASALEGMIMQWQNEALQHLQDLLEEDKADEG